MCDELGDEEMMEAYIEEAGNTSLCTLEGAGCNEKEKTYIGKMKAKTVDECKAQLTRLEGMEGNSMKPELKQWMVKRKKILKQLVAAANAGSEGEL